MKLKIIYDKPTIIYVPGWYSAEKSSHILELFLEKVASFKITFIYTPAWYLSSNSNVIINWLQRINKPNHTWFVACNDYFELMHMRNKGVKSFLSPQSCFLDEKIYKILEGTPKLYEAIYNAQLEPFKRHHLLQATQNCALVAYGKVSEYSSLVLGQIEGGDNINLLNKLINDSHYESIPWRRVVEIYNSSRVGLCLSEVEGAMYASFEYLLCGLPVVTTLNKGGRDYFFDGRYVVHCESTAEAVAASVDALKFANIDPYEIRSETLKKMHTERERFILNIEKILIDQGVTNPNFNEIFNSRFSNKLLGEVVEVDDLVDHIKSIQ